ncbi:MAG: hypothetical protein ABL982_18235 [Vicinamibacterales bacterium]
MSALAAVRYFDDDVMGLYAAKNAVMVAAQLRLGNTATRLFLHMCLECWDDEDNPAKGKPRRYYGRRELSAIALGFLAPDNGSEPAFRAVKRAVKELVDKGAIVRVGHGGNGRPAEFELQVDSTRPRIRGREPVVLAFPGTDQGANDSSPQRASF